MTALPPTVVSEQPQQQQQQLAAVGTAAVRGALSGAGLFLDFGAAVLRVRSRAAALPVQLQHVYGAFGFADAADFADLHVQIDRPRGLRRWIAPQVVFGCDGQHPFEPFPANTALPLLEWGANWLIGQRLNDLLLLHAGAVERDGLALLLPALPGSGKSTLTAALALSGWRLLSDEFGAFDPARGAFVPLLKAIALKNASIDVIRAFAPQARLGPSFPKTRKGTVAHLGASAADWAARHTPATPGAVILPRWESGSATRLEPLPSDQLFPALAFNAFNYTLLGAVGFDAVLALVRRCPAWTLVYSELADALTAIDALWQRVRAQHDSAAAAAEQQQQKQQLLLLQQPAAIARQPA